MLNSLITLVVSAQSIAVLISGLLFTVSFIIFVSVVISFLVKRAKGDTNGMKQTLDMLWWSVFAMFILMAVWGLVFFLSTNLGVGIGGCAPRPSAVPGVAATDGCNPTAGNSSAGGIGGVSSGVGKACGAGLPSCAAGQLCDLSQGGVCVIP